MVTKKPPLSATINFGHPLADGMVACFLVNELGGPIIDLVSGVAMPLHSGTSRVIAPWGIGLDCRGAGRGASTVTWKKIKEVGTGGNGNNRGWTIVWRGSIGASPTAFSGLAVNSFDAARSSQPFSAFVLAFNATADGYFVNWNDNAPGIGTTGKSYSATASRAFDGSERQVVAATFGADGNFLYEDGNKVISAGVNTQTTNPNFLSDARTGFCAGASTDPGDSKAIVRHVYFYRRALSQAEVQWLWVEPYAFINTKARLFFFASTNVILSPSGIASAEAFGTPDVLPGAVILSPGGIASAEAFGTPVVTVAATTAIMPDGIASAEAFGTPAIVTGAVSVTPTGIVSGEAFGTPRILQSNAARLLIGAVDRTAYLHLDSEFSWNAMKGARGSCTIPLVVEPGDPTIPLPGEFIEIFDPVGSRVWAGTVEEVFCRWFGNGGHHLFIVTGVTLESLFDGEVDKTRFDAVTTAEAFEDLYAASGVTAVTLGDVDTGETITALEVTRISDGFTSLALRSNKVWFVDPADLTLNLISATARTAPWIMTEDEILWETAQWRHSRADFRDTEVIQSPDGSTQTIIAVTAQAGLGRRAARLTLTTSYTTAGAIQEATAALHRFATLPSQLVVSTDRPGIAIGMLLELDVALPLEASGLLNGTWQVVELEARMLTGMSTVDPTRRRLPEDLQLGHFRYTLHLVNSLSTAIFQGDGSTTVFTLPVTPGSVSSINVSPHPELYSTSSLGADVTITPAMPAGTHALVDYQGDFTPDVGSWLDTWRDMSPLAASAGPTSSTGGAAAQRFIADATLRDLTIQDDAGPHAIVYHDGTGSRALVVLRQVLGADLVVRINLGVNELVSLVVPVGTAVDDVQEYPLSARVFTVTITSPGVVTVVGASLANDAPVVLHTSGALPTGLLVDTVYYVINTTGTTFQLAATVGGTAIDTSGTQSGTHWLTSSAIPAPTLADKDVLTYDILDSDGTIDTTPGGIANITLEWE
jgi:hypothetical protein